MSYAMADGYNTWFNGYDNQIYVVGRGPSATTVTGTTDWSHNWTPSDYTGHSDGYFRWHNSKLSRQLTFQMVFHAHLTQA